jgi:predicted phage terminase large subunit-like protein
LILGERSKRSFKQFIKSFWHVVEPSTPFVDGWHIDAFVDHLVHLSEIRNLLVTCPPGVSKSLVFCVFFPAWKWIQEPGAKYLYASYALKLAERDSVKCRQLIESPLYQKCFASTYKLSEDQHTKLHFANDRTGSRQSVGVFTATKGFKGNHICLDDPHSAEDVNSEANKRSTINWFVEGFQDRLCNFNQDTRVVVGQRIAKDDLFGFILDNYADSWTHISLPYEYRPSAFVSPIGWSDPRTVEGEALAPDRFPEKEIRVFKRSPSTWAAQWQQDPSLSAADAIFRSEDFRYYDDTPDGYLLGERRVSKSEAFRIMSCDIATSTGRRGDYCVFMILDVFRSGDIVLVHSLRDKLGLKLIPTMAEMYRFYSPAYIIVEDVSMAKHVINDARAEGLPVRSFKVQGLGDKEERSIPLQVRMESGQIWFPKNKDYVRVIEQELCGFPLMTHDDCVDALAQAVIEASKRVRGRKGREEETKRPEKTEQQRYWAAIMEGIS